MVDGIAIDLDPIGHNGMTDFSELSWIHTRLALPIRFIVDTINNDVYIDVITDKRTLSERATKINSAVLDKIILDISGQIADLGGSVGLGSLGGSGGSGDSVIVDSANIMYYNKDIVEYLLDNIRNILSINEATGDKIYKKTYIIDFDLDTGIRRNNLFLFESIIYSHGINTRDDIMNKYFNTRFTSNDTAKPFVIEKSYRVRPELLYIIKYLSRLFYIRFLDKNTISYRLMDSKGNIVEGNWLLFDDNNTIPDTIIKNPHIYNIKLYDYLVSNDLYYPIHFVVDFVVDIGEDIKDIYNQSNSINPTYPINPPIIRQNINTYSWWSSKSPILHIDGVDIKSTQQEQNNYITNQYAVSDFINDMKYGYVINNMKYNINNLETSINKICIDIKSYFVYNNVHQQDDTSKIYDLLFDDDKKIPNKTVVTHGIDTYVKHKYYPQYAYQLLESSNYNYNSKFISHINKDTNDDINAGNNAQKIEITTNDRYCSILDLICMPIGTINIVNTDAFTNKLNTMFNNTTNNIIFMNIKMNNPIVGNVLYLFHKQGTNKITVGTKDYYYDIIAFIKRQGSFPSFDISPEEPYVVKAKRDLSGNPLSGSIGYVLIDSDDPNEQVIINNRTILMSISKILNTMIYDTIIWSDIDNPYTNDPNLLIFIDKSQLYDDIPFIHTITSDIFIYYDRFGFSDNATMNSSVINTYFVYDKQRYEIEIINNENTQIYKCKYDSAIYTHNPYAKTHTDEDKIIRGVFRQGAINRQLLLVNDDLVISSVFYTPFGWFISTIKDIQDGQNQWDKQDKQDKQNRQYDGQGNNRSVEYVLFGYDDTVVINVDLPIQIYKPLTLIDILDVAITPFALQDSIYIKIIPNKWYNLIDTDVQLKDDIYDAVDVYIKNRTNKDLNITIYGIVGFNGSSQPIQLIGDTITIQAGKDLVYALNYFLKPYRSLLIHIDNIEDIEAEQYKEIDIYLIKITGGNKNNIDKVELSNNIQYDKDYIFKTIYDNPSMLVLKDEILQKISDEHHDYPVFSYAYLMDDTYNMIYHSVDPIKSISMDRPYAVLGRIYNSPYYQLDENDKRMAGYQKAGYYTRVMDTSSITDAPITSTQNWFMQINTNHIIHELLYTYTGDPSFASYLSCVYNNNYMFNINKNKLLTTNTWIIPKDKIDEKTGQNTYGDYTIKDKFTSNICYTIVDSNNTFVFGNRQYRIITSDNQILDGYQASIILYPIPIYKNISDVNDKFPISIQFVRDDMNKQVLAYVFYPIGVYNYMYWTPDRQVYSNRVKNTIVNNDMNFFIDDIYNTFIMGKSESIFPSLVLPDTNTDYIISPYVSYSVYTTQYNHVFVGNNAYWYSGMNWLTYSLLWFESDIYLKAGINPFMMDIFDTQGITTSIISFKRLIFSKDNDDLFRIWKYDKREYTPQTFSFFNDILFFITKNSIYGFVIQNSSGFKDHAYETKFVIDNIYIKHPDTAFIHYCDYLGKNIFTIDYSNPQNPIYVFNYSWQDNEMYPVSSRFDNPELKTIHKTIIDNLFVWVNKMMTSGNIDETINKNIIKTIYVDQQGQIYDGYDINKWAVIMDSLDYDFIDISDKINTKVIKNKSIKSIVCRPMSNHVYYKSITQNTEHITRDNQFWLIMSQYLLDPDNSDYEFAYSGNIYYFGDKFIYPLIDIFVMKNINIFDDIQNSIDTLNQISQVDQNNQNNQNNQTINIQQLLANNDVIIYAQDNSDSIHMIIDYDNIIYKTLVNMINGTDTTDDITSDIIDNIKSQYNKIDINLIYNNIFIPTDIVTITTNGRYFYIHKRINREQLYAHYPNINIGDIIFAINNSDADNNSSDGDIKLYLVAE